MAADSVIALPTALALKHAGLDYLLFDVETARELRSGTKNSARQADGEQTAARPRIARENPSRAKNAPPAHLSQQSSCPSDSPAAALLSERAGEMPVEASPPEKWPRVWRECLQKTRAAPILWTYWELGRDLCGTPGPERRELVRRLLKELDRQKGTHCFWPAALPAKETGELEANAPLFWAGARLLKSRAVVIMGSDALHAAVPRKEAQNLRPHMQKRLWGHTIIVLHSPDALIKTLAGEIQAKALYAFLRAALEPFSAL